MADASAIEWTEHSRIKNIFMKTLLTSEDNPLANISLVKVPPGGEVTRHIHPKEVESIYVLAGQSTLFLGETEVTFNAGQVVAIPIGLEHGLRNEGAEAVELITFFTPPIA
jgi:quercetin dioxygenase-like cupin family protein